MTHACPLAVFTSCLATHVLSWLSKKQPTVATSNCEAEYRVVFTSTVGCIWLKRLMADLGVGQSSATTILTHSQSALAVDTARFACFFRLKLGWLL